MPRIDEKDSYPNDQQIYEKVVMSSVNRQIQINTAEYNAIHLPKYLKCKIFDQKSLLDKDKWILHVGFEANQGDANAWSWLKSKLHRSTLVQNTAVFMLCIFVQWAVQIPGDPQEYKRAKL